MSWAKTVLTVLSPWCQLTCPGIRTVPALRSGGRCRTQEKWRHQLRWSRLGETTQTCLVIAPLLYKLSGTKSPTLCVMYRRRRKAQLAPGCLHPQCRTHYLLHTGRDLRPHPSDGSPPSPATDHCTSGTSLSGSSFPSPHRTPAVATRASKLVSLCIMATGSCTFTATFHILLSWLSGIYFTSIWGKSPSETFGEKEGLSNK